MSSLDTSGSDTDDTIPVVWRPAIRSIVSAFVRGDYHLENIPCVDPVDQRTADQIRDYIADYGEMLAELPEETWKSSLAHRMRVHWDLLVDLWTVPSGKSDMVLAGRVFESDNDGGFRIVVDSVHVP